METYETVGDSTSKTIGRNSDKISTTPHIVCYVFSALNFQFKYSMGERYNIFKDWQPLVLFGHFYRSVFTMYCRLGSKRIS